LRSGINPVLEQKAFGALLELGRKRGIFRQQGEHVSLAGHRVSASEEDRSLMERICSEYERAGVLGPRVSEIAERLGRPAATLKPLFQHLVRQGELVHLGGELYASAAAVSELQNKLVEFLKEHGQITTQQFKAMVGGTRKHVIPLAELFDKRKLTIRKGDVRVLRKETN
ncbi:MAG: selenocysteine-specific translation factor, partial [Deltaproteobacteria bacterium]